jgi:hypothetical protein
MTMKTIHTAAVLSIAMLLGACGTADHVDPSRRRDSNPDPCHTEQEIADFDVGENCAVLYAGQSIVAGKVCTRLDDSVDTSEACGVPRQKGAMLVTYSTINGWELVEAHLAAGDSLADIPTNNAGNPQIGNFPFKSGDITGDTSYTFTVPYCSLDLDLTECPVSAYVAAHAAVRRLNCDGAFQSETAWGDGEQFVERGSWAEYMTFRLECPAPDPVPPVPACETAWAGFGSEEASSFHELDCLPNDSRWGWSIGPVEEGNHTFAIHAAAGGGKDGVPNDPVRVGSLDVVYDGSKAMVTYRADSGIEFDETHLYVGSAPLMGYPGECTVAPGQFPSKDATADLMVKTYTVSGLSGPIYLTAHAVACGIEE